MAAFDYAELAQTALELINDTGRTLRLVKLRAAATDPAAPWRGAASPRVPPADTALVKGVAVDPRNAASLGHSMRDSDFVKRADLIYILGAGEDPKAFHEVVDGDRRYRIEEVQELRPGDETLLYYVAVKQ